MDTPSPDWNTLEARLFDAARRLLERWIGESPEPLYAAAFYGSYREEDEVIGLPSFAANSLAALEADHPGWRDDGFWGIKWNPADWRWEGELDALDDTFGPLMADLDECAAEGGRWFAIEQAFIACVNHAAQALHRHFAGQPGVRVDFAVFFHDEEGGPELARASLPPALFAQHFPEQDATARERQRIASLPEAEQVACYVRQLDNRGIQGIGGEEAERWLIAHGEAAAALLIPRLDNAHEGWKAAMILGMGGVRDTRVIGALRERLGGTGADTSTRHWCATALGYLGDSDWLLRQADDHAWLEAAVQGCCANLRGFRDRCAQPPALDYRPLERLLERHPEATEQVEETIAPGRGLCTLAAQDIAEALRGLHAPQPAIRWHALCTLDSYRPAPGMCQSAIRTALATLRDDPHPTVARLARLALSD